MRFYQILFRLVVQGIVKHYSPIDLETDPMTGTPTSRLELEYIAIQPKINLNQYISSLDQYELSKLFAYRRIRREFSKILYQNKFNDNVEHELGEETFNLLYQTVFFCLVNLSDNTHEYKILKRVLKNLLLKKN